MSVKIGFNGRVLADREMRGWTRYTVGLLRALSRFEEIDLILFSMEEPWPGHLDGIRAKVVLFKAARESVWTDWMLPRMIRREGIAIFHAPADRGLPLLKPCPFVVTLHNSYERTHWRTLFRGPKSRAWYWKNELVNHYRSDAVITVSDTTRAELVKLNTAPIRKLHRIHLAPAPEFRADRDESDDQVLGRYGISEPYLLYVGGYDAHKNVETLVDAFAQAHLPAHQLVVVGEHKWGYERLVSCWRTHPSFSRLRFIEVDTDDIPVLFRNADVFVNPSLWESFSFQLVEAMACGTPILASNASALPEIAGDAAILFDPSDPPCLARLMERVTRNAGLKSTLRARGLRRVAELSWQRTAAATLQVYREVLAANGERGFLHEGLGTAS